MSEAWFRFFSSDWIAGTAGLTAAEKGVYITLIASIYDFGGPLKRDDARLSRLCGLPKASFVRALGALIDGGKIDFDGQCLSNSRAKIELTERENRICKAHDAANARWEKDKENQLEEDAVASQEQCDSNAKDMPHARVPQPQPQSTSLHSVDSTETKVSASSEFSEKQQRTDFFRRGKEIIGANGGGVITKLLKAKDGNLARARAALEEASQACDPKEYIGAIIRNRNHKSEQELRDAGELW